MPVEGGAESLMVESLPASLWGGWGITGDRIFYLSLTPDAPSKAQLINLPLDTRKPEVVAKLPFSPVLWDGSLGISSTGNRILVAEAERAGSEIRLRYIP